MSKNQQNAPRPTPELRQGHSCDGCRENAERIANLEATADGLTVMILMAGGFAATVGGRAIPRCNCGRFCTRLFTLDHPIAGTTTQLCCDECDVSGPLVSGAKVTEQAFGAPGSFYTAEHLAYSRKVNSALNSVSLSAPQRPINASERAALDAAMSANGIQ